MQVIKDELGLLMSEDVSVSSLVELGIFELPDQIPVIFYTLLF
jgi:hypothetical protein